MDVSGSDVLTYSICFTNNLCTEINAFSLIVVVVSHCRCKECRAADSSGSEG